MPKKAKLPATEQRNPRSRGLDLKSSLEIARIINREDARVAAAVRAELRAIASAIEVIARALRNGGRMFSIGAGTSGRLAVLDASEIPPTFGVPSTMVQGVIAGGRRALTDAVEGAEDDFSQGAKDLRARKLSRKDVVIGVAASGGTPYVLGALAYAKTRGARTIAIACNKGTAIGKAAEIAIEVAVGPEVVTGSTRMKSGTAQKMVLNMLSTGAMVRLGHVYDNWMINVAKTNKKLRRRALRILTEAAGVDVAKAEQAMRQSNHDLRVALVAVLRKVGEHEAARLLKAAGGNLRKALKG